MAIQPKTWKRRRHSKACYEWAIEHKHNSFMAHLLSGRYTSVMEMEAAMLSTMKDMDKPATLPDIDKAAKRIAKAIINGEVIGIETDHDADGVTSHAVILTVLADIIGHPREKIRSYIGHRLIEGYGLSDSVADRIIADDIQPTLVITADNGSSDELRIAKLKLVGIDTIVTDHHEIPESGIPLSAFAVITPTREDSLYPDPLIAGCMVACLTMAAVRQELISQNFFSSPPASVSTVFDYVALGTVADCVSMSRSKNNRLVVEYGLKLINENKRPCWRALKPYIGNNSKRVQPNSYLEDDSKRKVTAMNLGFDYGPRLNARGRLEEAFLGVRFLVTKDVNEAVDLAVVLNDANNERKRIEVTLKEAAFVVCEDYVSQGYESLVIYLEEGHPGVHGIVSSRVTEAFGRPSIMISPKLGEPGIVSASARGVPGFDVRGALQSVDNKYPGLLTKFGGHKGAAGMSFLHADIEHFRSAFEVEAKLQIEAMAIKIGPVIFTDGPLPHSLIKLSTIAAYASLEPFGREMDTPLFEAKLKVVSSNRMGADKNHLSMLLQAGSIQVKGVMFNIDSSLSDEELGVNEGSEKNFLFSLSKNLFRGDETLQLMIQGIE